MELNPLNAHFVRQNVPLLADVPNHLTSISSCSILQDEEQTGEHFNWMQTKKYKTKLTILCSIFTWSQIFISQVLGELQNCSCIVQNLNVMGHEPKQRLVLKALMLDLKHLKRIGN